MKNNILNFKGVQKLTKTQQEQTFGGHIGGIGDAKSHITWKCYRNDSGSRFFFSPVDLSSPTTICYAIDNTHSAPAHPTTAGPTKPM